MFKRIVAFIALFPAIASATTWVDEFPIYVQGDVDWIESSLNALASISGSQEVSILLSMAGLIVIALRAPMILGKNRASLAKDVTLLIMGAMLLLSGATKTQVHIRDTRADTGAVSYSGGGTSYRTVANVPYPVALIAGISTTVTYEIAKLVESAFAPVDDASYSKVGFAGGIKALLDVSKKLNMETNETLYNFSSNFSHYMRHCAINQGVFEDASRMRKITGAQEDIFESVKPSSMGVTGSTYKITESPSSSVEMTCQEFWDANIASNASGVADQLFSMANTIAGRVELSQVASGLENVYGAGVSSALIGGTAAQFKGFLLNMTVNPAIQKAISNTAMGMELSGQGVANEMSAARTKRTLQTEGAGNFLWIAEVVPLYTHFMRGIVYFVFLLMALWIQVIGWDAGKVVLKSYFKGMMTIELTVVSLALVQGAVNFYAKRNAADMLAYMGSNVATSANIPDYVDYLASMTGIAGIGAATVIVTVPMMVFKGEIAAAMNGLGSAMGRYHGNNIDGMAKDTADHDAESKARRSEEARSFFERNGIEVPEGFGALDYYNQYRTSMADAGNKLSAVSMSSSSLESQFQTGTMVQSMHQTMETIGAGRNMTSQGGRLEVSEIVTSGLNTGGTSLSSKVHSGVALSEQGVTDENGVVSSRGDKAYIAMGTTAAASVAQMGDMTVGEAIASGKKASDDKIAAARGAIKSQTYNEDGSEGTEHDKYMRGGEFQERMKINKGNLAAGLASEGKDEGQLRQMMADIQAAAGGTVLNDISKAKGSRKVFDAEHDEKGYLKSIDNDGMTSYKDADGNTHKMSMAKAMEMIGDAEMHQTLGKGAGIYSNTNGGKDMDIYAANAQYSEMSQQQKTAAKIAAQGGIDGSVETDVAESRLKAVRQMAALQGDIDTYASKAGVSGEELEKAKEYLAGAGDEVGKRAASKILDAINSVAHGSAAMKAGGDIAQVNAASTSFNGNSFLDEKGDLTQAGQQALNQGEIFKLAPQLNRAEVFSSPDAQRHAANAVAEAALGKGASDEEKRAWLDANGLGNAGQMSGEEFASNLAGRMGTVFASQNQMAFGDSMVSMGLTKDGATAVANSGINKNINNQDSEKAGLKLDAGVAGELVGDIESQRLKELADMGMSPRQLVSTALGKGFNAGSEYLQETLGVSEDTANSMMEIGAMAGGGAALVGTMELAAKAAGRKGPIHHLFKSGAERGADSFDASSGHSAVGPSSDIDNDIESQSKANGSRNNPFHGTPPSSYNPNIPETGGPVNPTQMGSNLNGTSFYHDGEGLVHAGPKPSPDMGSFGGRVDAAMDAINGGGSWKTKLGLAASAMILGSQSDVFANAMDAADPMSHLMGVSIDPSSDLDYAAANGMIPRTNRLQPAQGMPVDQESMKRVMEETMATQNNQPAPSTVSTDDLMNYQRTSNMMSNRTMGNIDGQTREMLEMASDTQYEMQDVQDRIKQMAKELSSENRGGDY